MKYCQQPFTNELFCSKVGIIRAELLFLWILSMCKLWGITHKLSKAVKFMSDSPGFKHIHKNKIHSYSGNLLRNLGSLEYPFTP